MAERYRRSSAYIKTICFRILNFHGSHTLMPSCASWNTYCSSRMTARRTCCPPIRVNWSESRAEHPRAGRTAAGHRGLDAFINGAQPASGECAGNLRANRARTAATLLHIFERPQPTQRSSGARNAGREGQVEQRIASGVQGCRSRAKRPGARGARPWFEEWNARFSREPVAASRGIEALLAAFHAGGLGDEYSS